MEPGFDVMGRLHRARWGRWIERLADGELSGAHAGAVRHHLAECQNCAGDLEYLRCVKDSLVRLGERRPTDLVVARLQARAERLAAF